ncbi:hypothetical protein MTR67_032113, partial [Solanum verrucosum]
DLGLGDGRDYRLISDMQKGITSIVIDLLPEVEHMMCARHILANWAKDWRDKDNFINLQRNMVNKYFSNGIESVSKEHRKVNEMSYRVQWRETLKFQMDLMSIQIDMRSRTYNCRSWMLKGIPCSRAIVVILYKKWEPIDYIDNCYKLGEGQKKDNDFDVEALARGRGRTCEPIATSTIGRASVRDTTATTTFSPARGRNIGLEKAATTPAGGRSICIRKVDASIAKRRGIGIERVDTTPAKGRCICIERAYLLEGTVGIGGSVVENDFTTYNPIKPTDFTGELGTGVKWKAKEAMASNQLKVMRDEMRVNKI